MDSNNWSSQVNFFNGWELLPQVSDWELSQGLNMGLLHANIHELP